MRLGDLVKKALDRVGITQERVAKYLNCNCARHQARLNALGAWAMRVLAGRTEKAEEYLDRLTEDDR
jgi:hypothetical protein